MIYRINGGNRLVTEKKEGKGDSKERRIIRRTQIKIGPDSFWIGKMSKLQFDTYERTYDVTTNSTQLARLIRKRAEADDAFEKVKITRPEYNEEVSAIEEDIDKFQKAVMKVVTKRYKGEDQEFMISTIAAMELLAMTVWVPEIDEKGEVIYDEDVPRLSLKTWQYWLEEDDTLTQLLKRITQEFQLWGLDEPVSCLDEALLLFESDEEPMPPEEVVKRIYELREGYITGEIQQKKSDGVYAVQIVTRT